MKKKKKQAAPAKTPDRVGASGVKGWKVTAQAHKLRPDHAAGVVFDQWLIYHPTSHPFWHYYMVGLVHLRDVPGQSKPAFKQFPQATHEILFVALSPDHKLPAIDDWEAPHTLSPVDLSAQFEVNSDEEAANVLAAVIDTIIAGAALDVDHSQRWTSAIAATAAHERTGEHR